MRWREEIAVELQMMGVTGEDAKDKNIWRRPVQGEIREAILLSDAQDLSV